MLLKDIVHLEKILDGSCQPTGLKLSLLEYMTDDFSEKREIGRGGFGVVYKVDFYYFLAYIAHSRILIY